MFHVKRTILFVALAWAPPSAMYRRCRPGVSRETLTRRDRTDRATGPRVAKSRATASRRIGPISSASHLNQAVSLESVTRANVRAVCELKLADHQRHLVAPPAYTVAEGNYEPEALLRAICVDGCPVGVLLVEVETGTPYLVRFMVAATHQARGVGRRAVELLLDELRAGGWQELETSFYPGDDGPGNFWRRCGFLDTGRERHGEPLVARQL